MLRPSCPQLSLGRETVKKKKKDSCPGEAQANMVGVFTWFILTGE